MTSTVAVLVTLDTKAQEADFLRARIEDLGGRALIVDVGVVGTPGTSADVTREEVADAGGTPLATILQNPTRQHAAPVMVGGATRILLQRIADGQVHAVLGLGGTQGTSTATAVMRALPYGFPKVMVSTVASGDVSTFVDIKDITMMFSVGDLLGLNPITRRILANAAGAAWGMSRAGSAEELVARDKPLVGLTNLGVLTDGALHAIDLLGQRGYETIVFHAVGSGGRAMEQMMKDGLIGAVFDYALGEISDELFDGLRSSGPERLTVAAELGLPQVLCPGGAEHVGLFVDPPDTVPAAWAGHLHVFHSPVILAPRLDAGQLRRVAEEVGRRMANGRGRACLMLPGGGTSRYAVAGGPLHDPEGDRAFFDALRGAMPDGVEVVERDLGAEDPAFVAEAVERLVALIEADGAGPAAG